MFCRHLPSATYSGRHGRLTFTSELAASKVRAPMFAAIVIPGGYAPDRHAHAARQCSTSIATASPAEFLSAPSDTALKC